MLACLLALLDEQPSYGYEVLRRLRVRGWGTLDRGRAYRALRDMEAQGLLRSRWLESSQGPRRRGYSVTPAGRDALQVLIDEIREACSLLSGFLAARGGGS